MGYTLEHSYYLAKIRLMPFKASVETYREHFQQTALNMSPTVMHNVCDCNDTEEEAQDLLHALDVWLLGKRQFAEFDRFPSIETDNNITYDRDKRVIARRSCTHLSRTIEQVKPRLDAMIQEFKADEVLVVPLLPGIDQRCRTIERTQSVFINKERMI